MRVTINKSIASGIISAPPSKSYAHRMLIAAGLSKKTTIVQNIVKSNDIIATINCLETLGKKIEYNGNKVVITNEKNLNQLPNELVFNCLESGSTFRFFIPIALITGKKVTFIGTKRLIERGIGPYEEILNKQGIEIIKTATTITFNGKLRSDNFEISGNISSQFITGLLFATPLLEENSKIKITTTLESKNYIDITLDVLNKSKIKIETKQNEYYINGNQEYTANELIVEGDYSNGAFLDALNYLNGSVTLTGLNENSSQGDKVYKDCFEKLNKGYATIDISNCIDLGPILFCFSALKYGGHFIKTSRLKIKESNRVNDLAKELKKFNVEVIDLGDEVIINNQKITCPNTILYGQNDHRIVMALAIMLTVYGGTIEGIEAVNKSYPNFFDDLKKLGIEVKDDAK